MRSIRWMYCVAALAALTFGLGATAQSCYKFTNNVSVYAEASSDGTNIYASVVLGGTYLMSGSGTCPIPPAGTHWPQVSGQLISGSGAQVSSTSGGERVCTSCYISGTNEQELPIDSDDSWTFYWQGEAMCSSAGLLVTVGGNSLIGLAWGNYIFNGMEGTQCDYMLYCPNGNTASTCGKQVPEILVDGPPANTCRNYLNDLRLTFEGKCFSIGKAALSSTPINCT